MYFYLTVDFEEIRMWKMEGFIALFDFRNEDKLVFIFKKGFHSSFLFEVVVHLKKKVGM